MIMPTFYFAQDNAINRIPSTPEYLDQIIHASFAGKLMKRLKVTDLGVIKQSAAELNEAKGFEKASLEDFIPSGTPFFVNAGHNMYTWKGIRGKYEFDSSILEGEYLMSPAVIGSGSDVYVPMLKVARRTKEKCGNANNCPLPHFMLWKNDKLIEARYDLNAGNFISVDQGFSIFPEQTKIISPPLSENSSDKEYGLGRSVIPRSRFVHWLTLRGYSNQERFRGKTVEELREKLEKLKKLIGFTPRRILNFKEESEVREIRVAAGILRDDKEQIHKINCSLLYKDVLEQMKKCLLVGKIDGDSYTIHLPYVLVEMRQRHYPESE